MKSITRLTCAAALLLAPISAVHADQYLSLGAGWFNFDANGNGNQSANFDGEYRGNPFFYGLLPVAGVNVNTDGGVYGYAGLNYDFAITPHIILTPQLAVGAWSRGGSEDLGGTLEFHEAFEADYKFDNNYRIGAQIGHTSNAGIYDRNPGADTVMAIVSIPLSR